MAITRLLAQMTVGDLDSAVDYYTRLFGRGPDERPMDGLVEWHLSEAFGVQVWSEPDRAGASAMVLDESELDARVAELDQAGIAYHGPQDATTSRIVQLADPDGNRIVLTGPFTDE
jgi:catechol 2,3-dioxygenase-like lactoylglutathione lyase family enzyme